MSTNTSMRIAMIGQKGIPVKQGGVERHVEQLSLALVSLGHDVRIYGRRWFTEHKDGYVDGIELIHTQGIRTKHFDAITHSFTALLHAMYSGVDVIHFHAVGPSLLCWIPRIFTPHIHIVATFHCIDRKHAKWGIFAKAALWIGEWCSVTFPHQTIAVSKTIRQYIRDTYSKKSTYIPNGVPTYTRSTQTDILKEFSITPYRYFTTISRLIPHKAIHQTLEAFILAKEQKRIPADMQYVVVGAGHYTDDYVDQLHSIAKGRNDIIFTGGQYGEALASLFSHAHSFVHTSLNEGMPISVLSAMSYGLPVLVSDIPEHCEVIQDTTYHCIAGDVTGIARGLAQLAHTDPSELTHTGEENRKRAISEFNWKDIAKETVLVYNETQQVSNNLQAQIV